MSHEELEFLAKTGLSAHKTSRRDLGYVLSQGLVGATTVSGTMVAAHVAGIDVFVTGGIGNYSYSILILNATQTFNPVCPRGHEQGESTRGARTPWM